MIYFYDVRGERRMMNYSSLGERTVTAWFQMVLALVDSPLTKFEEGCGPARGWQIRVNDEARVRELAAAAGIRVAFEH